MICNKCNKALKCIRSVLDGRTRYRIRVCPECGYKIYTEETEAPTMYAQLVIANDNSKRVAEYRKQRRLLG